MDGNRSGRLLLVEDENLLRGLIAQFLRGEGFEIVEAADGLQGVESFSSRGPFDLVLLDLNLPLLHGVEVCRRIKTERPAQRVIICSAAILDSHLAELGPLQVDHFLSKPYHPLELLERISLTIFGSQRRTREGAPRSTPCSRWRVDSPDSQMSAPHTLVKLPLLD
jgi:DNA-binding response OmpR family regulator